MIKTFIIGLLLILTGMAKALPQEDVIIIKDLNPDWKIFSNNQYQNYDQTKGAKTIYFLIDTKLYKGALLQIESQKKFSVFIRGRLIMSNIKGTIFCNLDSLSALYTNLLDFSILIPAVSISTKIVMKNMILERSESLIKRNKTYFLDFSIIATLVLLTMFGALLRANPKLTFDYLNFIKLFSVQEREENTMAIRITSSVNLLFYTFASLLTAFLMIVIFHVANAESSLANFFEINSLKQAFYQWLKLTALILLLLFSKLLLITMFSNLFKATEITALHFFNFIRLFFFTFGLISILMVIFFISKVLDPAWYYNLFYVASGIFIFWEIILILKLMPRVPFRIFHLFFYLCAAELIPLVIILKVVFY